LASVVSHQRLGHDGLSAHTNREGSEFLRQQSHRQSLLDLLSINMQNLAQHVARCAFVPALSRAGNHQCPPNQSISFMCGYAIVSESSGSKGRVTGRLDSGATGDGTEHIQHMVVRKPIRGAEKKFGRALGSF